MENQTDINVLIIHLLSGEANETEKATVAEWLNQSVENRKLYADLRDIWLSSGTSGNADEYDLEGAIRKFREQISSKEQPSGKQIHLMSILKYAAVAALVLAIPFSYYFGTRNSALDNSTTTIACAFGDKTSIVLPDSSKVWLNSGSKISFCSDFKNKERNVQLEGEAFFSVTKDKRHPFKVKTAGIQVEVLGTQFNLKAYPEEKTISTTLVEGSLLVSSNTQETRIAPDQKLVFDKANQKMVLQNLADTAPETEWKDGRFVFRNETLEELEPRLERWFDVEIVFADEQAKRRRFTGVLERESILEAISYFDSSKFISCKVDGNKIIIKSENN